MTRSAGLIAFLMCLALIGAGCTPEAFIQLAPMPAPTLASLAAKDVRKPPAAPPEEPGEPGLTVALPAADATTAPEAEDVAATGSEDEPEVGTIDLPAGEEEGPTAEAPPAASPSPAQAPLPQLVYGETRRGEITDRNLADAWAFAGDAGDAIYFAVETTSGNLDAVVELRDEAGRSVFPAGSDIQADARGALALPYTGQFQLAVTPVEGTRGGYTIGLTQTTIQSLEIGETRRGQLTTAEPVAVWRLQGTPGADVDLQARSDADLSPRLFLLAADADEQPLPGEDGDHAGGLVVRLPDSGQIQIGVTELERRAGAYSLQAALAVADEAEVDAEAPPVTIPEQSWRSLSFGGDWGDYFDYIDYIALEDRVIIDGHELYAHVYRLEGEVGRTAVFDLDAVGSTLDAILRLYDAEWNLLDQDDDVSSPGAYLSYTFATTAKHFLVVAVYPDIVPTESSPFDYYLSTHDATGLEAGMTPADWASLFSDGNPEPFPIRLDVAAGDVDVEQTEVGSERQRCVGWTTVYPSFGFEWWGSPAELRVSFIADEWADTTLVIQDPAGNWHCDDDAGVGLNPSVLLPQPAQGDYAVWIGTFSRQPVAGDLVFQWPASGMPTADPPPTTAQSCGLAEAVYGNVDVGSLVILGRHRWVGGDTHWNERMEAYVGQTAVVTGLGGADESGCPGVRVDLDGGAGFWRLRDLVLLDE